MDEKTVRALGAINRDFYHASAVAFDQTRRDAWPGWQPLAGWIEERLPSGALKVLDVGCGNGRFAAFLADALPDRSADLDYCGLDASRPLLDSLRMRRLPIATTEALLCDLIQTPVESLLAGRAFSLIAAFGLLHHIPGEQTRATLLRSLAQRLEPGGMFVLAFWRFEDFERFRIRRKTFEEWNRAAPQAIDLSQLEPGDSLLRWGEGSDTVRYCHHVDDAEADRLLDATGLERVTSYEADGREGSLNRYFVLVTKGNE